MRNASLMLLVFSGYLPADQGDETLRYYVARSTMIVAATITSQPVAIMDEAGVVNHLCDVAITDVFLSPAPLTLKKTSITVTRFEARTDDTLPFLKKGGRCILFLEPAPAASLRRLRTVDPWFGIQGYTTRMAESLKRLTGPPKARIVDDGGPGRLLNARLVGIRGNLVILRIGNDHTVRPGMEFIIDVGEVCMRHARITQIHNGTALAELIPEEQVSPHEPHLLWLAERLKEIRSITVGMSRAAFLEVFQVEGGIQPIPAERYVLKSCPWIKVTARFDKELKITSISEPRLGMPIFD